MQLAPVLYSQFVSPDRRPDRVLIGEARPEDGVRILETNPSSSPSASLGGGTRRARSLLNSARRRSKTRTQTAVFSLGICPRLVDFKVMESARPRRQKRRSQAPLFRERR